MSSSGSEKFRQAADGRDGAATGADTAEDGTITAAACWLGRIFDDEVQSLLRERGEAVATLARLRACSWLAGSLVSGTTEVDAGGYSVSLGAAVDTPLIDLKFPWRDTCCKMNETRL